MMIDKGLSVGDYILITDSNDYWHYLHIGVIKSISLWDNGTIRNYNVQFNFPCVNRGNNDRYKEVFRYCTNLSERCKVLCFKEEE